MAHHMQSDQHGHASVVDVHKPACPTVLVIWVKAGMHTTMQLFISSTRFGHLSKCQKVRMGLDAIRGIHGMHIPTTFDIHMY